MRFAAWAKSVVQWRCADVLYLSIPFTWLLSQAEGIASGHKGKVVAGGPAVQLMGAPWADETPDTCPFDVLAMHNPLATFTTRGCPNSCPFCAVPKLEGGFRELAEWKAAPIVCDNNLLAASKTHFHKVIESLLPFPACDFNQGLDARLFKRWHADELARLPSVKVRFAFDSMAMEGPVADAISAAREAGLEQFGVYVLIGFNDTPDDARHRLETVREWNVLPNPMRYQPLHATMKNQYIAPGWTGSELLRMTRYYSRLIHLGHIPYDEYRPPKANLFTEVV